jgi:hypothetical protein
MYLSEVDNMGRNKILVKRKRKNLALATDITDAIEKKAVATGDTETRIIESALREKFCTVRRCMVGGK